MRSTLLCWHHFFKFSGNDRPRNRVGGVGTCCWTLVAVKLCWFKYWYTVIIYVSLILPNAVSFFFYKNEGKRRFVIAFKIVIGLCYFSPLPWTPLKWVLSLCFFDNFQPFVHFSTIDSFRLFLHRVSSHHYLYHRQNMDPMYPLSTQYPPRINA